MVLINKYIYKVAYVEPAHDDPKRGDKIDDVHFGSTAFIGNYLLRASYTCSVTGAEMDALIQKEFPGLIHFMMESGLFGGRMPRASDGVVDFDVYSYHLEVLIPLNWMSLYQTAELEEKRRGLAIRYIL